MVCGRGYRYIEIRYRGVFRERGGEKSGIYSNKKTKSGERTLMEGFGWIDTKVRTVERGSIPNCCAYYINCGICLLFRSESENSE
jgi:hypothetical protein